MRIIGLTGGIASGKSTIAHLLEQHGIPVIDADQLARRAVEPGSEALRAIEKEFGTSVINSDGTLNRQALATIVFNDPAERKKLEAITHPAIRTLAEEELNHYRAEGTPAVIYMAALLIEANIVSRVDEVWVVYIDQETQISRVMARDNCTREEAMSRIEAQIPMDEKVKLGKVVIDNRGTREELEQQVMDVVRKESLASQGG
jgi:dephospho-CoA kinase